MISRSRARYLRDYPRKIAAKRLRRKRIRARVKASKRDDLRHFRDVLREIRAYRGADEPVRAGKPGIVQRIKEAFKPSV